MLIPLSMGNHGLNPHHPSLDSHDVGDRISGVVVKVPSVEVASIPSMLVEPKRARAKLLECHANQPAAISAIRAAHSEKVSAWVDPEGRGAVAFIQLDRVWLAAEPIGESNSIDDVTWRFLLAARECKARVAFACVSGLTAQMLMNFGLEASVLSAVPWFDLTDWVMPEEALLRATVARDEGLEFSECSEADLADLREALTVDNFASGYTGGSWPLSANDPVIESSHSHFVLRDFETGQVIGWSSTVAIANGAVSIDRCVWHQDAPPGTEELLILQTLHACKRANVQFVCIHAIPIDAPDSRAEESNTLGALLRWADRSRRTNARGGAFRFQAHYAPTRWEREYVVAAAGLSNATDIAVAIAREVAPHTDDIMSALWNDPLRA